MISNVSSYIMPTYGDRSLEFKSGKGCYLTSTKNKKYLDFGSGIAVNSLGHCHPKLVKALTRQSNKLWHTSNLYYSSKQEEYAKNLCNKSFAEKVFFTNSGVEAIEAGLKVVRSYFYHHKKINKKNIITFEGAFHGRTFAALSAQKNNRYNREFKPLLPGFIQIPFNNIEEVKRCLDENTGAIMIEPIQGEGGIKPASLKFLEKIKKICDKNNILLFLDEVQCGFGRTGKLFAYEWGNFEPDILAAAKGIASGFPLGVCMAKNKACVGMTKGKHGSTYGGNPLAVSVGLETIKILSQKKFLNKVDKNSRYFWHKLKKLEKNFKEIVEIRGAGLLLGIKTRSDNLKIQSMLVKNGLLSVTASDNIIRLVPPLIVSKKEIDIALQIIEKTFKELR